VVLRTSGCDKPFLAAFSGLEPLKKAGQRGSQNGYGVVAVRHQLSIVERGPSVFVSKNALSRESCFRRYYAGCKRARLACPSKLAMRLLGGLDCFASPRISYPIPTATLFCTDLVLVFWRLGPFLRVIICQWNMADRIYSGGHCHTILHALHTTRAIHPGSNCLLLSRPCSHPFRPSPRQWDRQRFWSKALLAGHSQAHLYFRQPGNFVDSQRRP